LLFEPSSAFIIARHLYLSHVKIVDKDSVCQDKMVKIWQNEYQTIFD
jgi:hypothetical protein